MKDIIQKAIEGGYKKEGQFCEWTSCNISAYTLDPLFWQSLGKACCFEGSTYSWQKDNDEKWYTCAMKFHEINLTDSFQSAVEWLENIIKTK